MSSLPDNPDRMKRVLEAALLAAQQPMTLAELDARYGSEIAKYRRIVKTLNVRLE